MLKPPFTPPPIVRIALIVLAFALAPALAAPVLAQTRPDDPPYEQDLMRLSEILGALHYLRPLCGHDDGSLWRDEMSALIDAEVQDDSRRRRYIERFNQGFRGFSSVYRDCTPAAELTLSRYVEEAGAIVRDVTTRYNR
ncbi:TIGR02301 family protein [Stappia sp. GBMRC 2046]|uniref:TIGR02301 family protein n=2 Tax=Stappia sediminis TaxID=2692190 RepID=A0A7X3LVW9_9HYPH|nr:TIGR02301 family protein [Stappia sediminis]